MMKHREKFWKAIDEYANQMTDDEGILLLCSDFKNGDMMNVSNGDVGGMIDMFVMGPIDDKTRKQSEQQKYIVLLLALRILETDEKSRQEFEKRFIAPQPKPEYDLPPERTE